MIQEFVSGWRMVLCYTQTWIDRLSVQYEVNRSRSHMMLKQDDRQKTAPNRSSNKDISDTIHYAWHWYLFSIVMVQTPQICFKITIRDQTFRFDFFPFDIWFLLRFKFAHWIGTKNEFRPTWHAQTQGQGSEVRGGLLPFAMLHSDPVTSLPRDYG